MKKRFSKSNHSVLKPEYTVIFCFIGNCCVITTPLKKLYDKKPFTKE